MDVKLVCKNPKCKYSWTPRAKNPVACPKCKRYITDRKPV